MKKRIPTIVLDPHYEMDFKLKTYDEAPSYEAYYESFLLGKEVGVDYKDINVSEFKNLLNAAGMMTDAMEAAADEIFARGEDHNAFRARLDEIIEAIDMGEDGINKAIQDENNGDPDTAELILSLIHISEPTRQAEISYAVFCLKKKKHITKKKEKTRKITPEETTTISSVTKPADYTHLRAPQTDI